MGSFFSKTMDENLKKQQEFMLKAQELAMERQIAMQNEMRERQMAMMIAKSRDFFWYWVTFDTVVSTGLLVGAFKGKRYGLLLPLIPLSFVTTYQWDLAYGPKIGRMREMADRILDQEQSLLELPHGVPSFSSIEVARLDQKKDEPYKSGHDIFL